MSDTVERIASMEADEIRGVWWRINDPVLREMCPERDGERAAVIARAKVFRVDLEPKKTANRRRRK